MNMRRKMAMLLAVLMIFAVAAGCAKKGDDEFRVGMECGYAPFNWTQTDDSNGAVKLEDGSYAAGYDVEIAKRIAEGLGKKLVIVKTVWEGLEPAVNSGEIDAIIAGMSPTAEREERIDFTVPYYRSELVIVVKAGSQYADAKSIADFAGAKITAQQGTVHFDVIDQMEGVNKLDAMEDFSAMRVALESGIIDGYVSEKPEAVSAKAANSNFDFVEFEEGFGFNVSDEDVAVSVGLKNDSPDLVKKINEILASISEEEREKLMNNAIATQVEG